MPYTIQTVNQQVKYYHKNQTSIQKAQTPLDQDDPSGLYN